MQLSDLAEVLRQHPETPDGKTVLTRGEHGISRSAFPANALTVLNGLKRAGYSAYLVGGCIRDLLCGSHPKDYDVATNATPLEVRQVFRNSRIIGRRFKIVHVVFGRDIIEVTTFRGPGVSSERDSSRSVVSDDSGMLVRDNQFGRSVEDDALRRDFTINAIYYDIRRFEVLDFHGGLKDLIARRIDIIGDPEQRYHEDPVRMIRALRFAAKLGFTLTERTSAPLKTMADTLRQVKSRRMYDEVNKLFLNGYGLSSFRVLRDYGFTEILFPGIGQMLEDAGNIRFIEQALGNSDQRFAENKRNMPHFLYAVMLWPQYSQLVLSLQLRRQSMVQPLSLGDICRRAADSILRAQDSITTIPFNISQCIRAMWMMQFRLLETDSLRVQETAAHQLFRAAFDIFKIRAALEPMLQPYVTFWQPYYDRSAEQAAARKGRAAPAVTADEPPVRKAGSVFGKEGFTADTAADRNSRLQRARAWRARMHLDP